MYHVRSENLMKELSMKIKRESPVWFLFTEISLLMKFHIVGLSFPSRNDLIYHFVVVICGRISTSIRITHVIHQHIFIKDLFCCPEMNSSKR